MKRVTVSLTATLLAATAFAFAANETPRAGTGPLIRILAPRPSDVPVGPTTLEAAIDGHRSGDRVEFFADGRRIGSVDNAPWKLTWDAGDRPLRHQIEAVLFRDGREAASTGFSTHGIGFTATARARAVGLSPIVTDRSGRYVKGLKREDFLVYEDGNPRNVDTFDDIDSPLSVILVFDTSGSMLLKIADAREAAKRFLAALKPEDQAALLTFNSQITGFTSFTRDKASLRNAVDRLRPAGETALYDATATALKKLDSAAGRRAVVLFTDGEDNRSRMTVTQVIDRARASEASIYAVAQGNDESKVLKVYLDKMAGETGGKSYFIGAIKKLPGAFDEILAELKSQYFLTFTPKAAQPRTWHTVDVRPRNPDYTVRSKHSFFLD